MGTFDLSNELLTTSYNEVPPDQATPIPAGEYNVQIGTDDKAMKLEGGEKDGRPWRRLDLNLKIADPAGALKATHGATPTMRHGVMLDLIEGTTQLDLGVNRNVRLGKILEATGVRKSGWKLTDLYGKSLKIKVIHKPDRDDPTIIRAEVSQVGVASEG